MVSPVGTAFPLNCTAHGKAIPGTLDSTSLSHIIPEFSEQRTSASLTEEEILKADVSESRIRGYAIDREEHSEAEIGASLRAL